MTFDWKETQLLRSLLAGGLVLVCTGAVAAPLTYTFSFKSGENILIGLITTDGTIGPITTSAIVAWSFASAGSTSFAISSSSDGAGFQCLPVSGCFLADQSFLTYAFSSPTANDPFATFQSAEGSVSFVNAGSAAPAGQVKACGSEFLSVCGEYANPPDTFATRAPLDVDGDGTIDALTDGLLTLRYHFGFTGAALIAGAVGAECRRCTAPEILAYLQSLD